MKKAIKATAGITLFVTVTGTSAQTGEDIASSCETLGNLIVTETHGNDDPILNISGLNLNFLEKPRPGSRRMIECMGIALYRTGTWIVSFYSARHADGEKYWVINRIRQW